MKIYTRTGDNGTTGLFGGDRVSKAHLRMHAYGTIDELNACVSVALSMPGALPDDLKIQLERIQDDLFALGADLATPLSSKAKILRTDPKQATELEGWIDMLESRMEPLRQFIHLSGSPAGAELHRARTVCRRAERFIVELNEKEPIGDGVLQYVNRLSDYLFVAARFTHGWSGSKERPVVIKKA